MPDEISISPVRLLKATSNYFAKSNHLPFSPPKFSINVLARSNYFEQSSYYYSNFFLLRSVSINSSFNLVTLSTADFNYFYLADKVAFNFFTFSSACANYSFFGLTFLFTKWKL